MAERLRRPSRRRSSRSGALRRTLWRRTTARFRCARSDSMVPLSRETLHLMRLRVFLHDLGSHRRQLLERSSRRSVFQSIVGPPQRERLAAPDILSAARTRGMWRSPGPRSRRREQLRHLFDARRVSISWCCYCGGLASSAGLREIRPQRRPCSKACRITPWQMRTVPRRELRPVRSAGPRQPGIQRVQLGRLQRRQANTSDFRPQVLFCDPAVRGDRRFLDRECFRFQPLVQQSADGSSGRCRVRRPSSLPRSRSRGALVALHDCRRARSVGRTACDRCPRPVRRTPTGARSADHVAVCALAQLTPAEDCHADCHTGWFDASHAVTYRLTWTYAARSSDP